MMHVTDGDDHEDFSLTLGDRIVETSVKMHLHI